MEVKECLVCGKKLKENNYSKQRWLSIKYCSYKCSYEGHAKSGHPWRQQNPRRETSWSKK